MAVNYIFHEHLITELEILEIYIYKNMNLNISQIQGGKSNSGISFGVLLKPEQRQSGYTAFNCFPIIVYCSCT